ncbi:hypothetical protein M23134_01812 [Microscilla marina ATCC 23134]|uniref:Uncharacterized protein n=1 Tax=Microscilla marina ATCC 23134 TaxID=313606 RepID=A2A063_MICM2|nr:hypothetical protein M23134_01812 [Microscilla marina ATCC 23134]
MFRQNYNFLKKRLILHPVLKKGYKTKAFGLIHRQLFCNTKTNQKR